MSAAASGIEPRLLPALEALEAAVLAGEDQVARAVLARLLALGPTGAALELARAFERILDGRAALGQLDLRLTAEVRADAVGQSVVAVKLAATPRDGLPRQLRPGPATLRIVAESIDRAGNVRRALESHAFDALRSLEVTGDGPVDLTLLEFQARRPPGALALRLSFELELRSGTVHEQGRELPAGRPRVTPCAIAIVHGDLGGLGSVAPEELAARFSQGGLAVVEALGLAVRLPPTGREEALDLLAASAAELPDEELGRLCPALRWLAPLSGAGNDPWAWRRWLRLRSRGPEGPSDAGLVLPGRP